MKPIWSIILLIGLSLPIAGADLASDTNKKIGLTNKEAQDFFYQGQKYYLWKTRQTCFILSVTSLFGAAVLGFPAGFLTGMHCTNYVNQLNCLKQNNTKDFCEHEYPETPTLDDPICQLGISFFFRHWFIDISNFLLSAHY